MKSQMDNESFILSLEEEIYHLTALEKSNILQNLQGEKITLTSKEALIATKILLVRLVKYNYLPNALQNNR